MDGIDAWYEREIAKLKAQRSQKVKAARLAYLAELDECKGELTRAENLDQAIKVRDEMMRVQDAMKAAEAETKKSGDVESEEFTVSAKHGPTSAFVAYDTLPAGTRVLVVPLGGKWACNHNPDMLVDYRGESRADNRMALHVRCGEFEEAVRGKSLTFTVSEPAALEMHCNDPRTADNAGEIQVRVSIKRCRSQDGDGVSRERLLRSDGPGLPLERHLVARKRPGTDQQQIDRRNPFLNGLLSCRNISAADESDTDSSA
jgi:hypothetical protein